MSQQISVSLRSMRIVTAAVGLTGAVAASAWLLANRPAPAEREHGSATPEVRLRAFRRSPSIGLSSGTARFAPRNGSTSCPR